MGTKEVRRGGKASGEKKLVDEVKFRYIAIEGPPGAGKTRLAKRMARDTGGRVILEDIDNPFLDVFYQKKRGSAFQSQLFFLINRYMVQKDLFQKELFSEFLIADFIFEKDRIYAYLNLDDQDLLIYEKIFNIFAEGLPRPDLVIYLQASDEALRARLLKNKESRKDCERISNAYLSELNKAYNYYFFHYSKSPLLVVNTSEVDYSSEATSLDDLFGLIKRKDEGTEYYVPLGLE